MSTDATGVEQSPVQAQAAEGIVAELELDHERLPLRPTLRRVPDVSVAPEYRARLDSDETVLFVSVTGDGMDAFEAALGDDPTVDDPVLADRFPDRRVYRVRLTDAAVTIGSVVAGVGGRIVERTGTTTGWVVQLRLPDRDALVTLNDRYRRRGLSVRVTHLRTAAEDGAALLGLTAKQQELLTVAYEEGYFAVPRGISQDELAERLGVSKSAISQRLRRAIAELCAASL